MTQPETGDLFRMEDFISGILEKTFTIATQRDDFDIFIFAVEDFGHMDGLGDQTGVEVAAKTSIGSEGDQADVTRSFRPLCGRKPSGSPIRAAPEPSPVGSRYSLHKTAQRRGAAWRAASEWPTSRGPTSEGV